MSERKHTRLSRRDILLPFAAACAIPRSLAQAAGTEQYYAPVTNDFRALANKFPQLWDVAKNYIAQTVCVDHCGGKSTGTATCITAGGWFGLTNHQLTNESLTLVNLTRGSLRIDRSSITPRPNKDIAYVRLQGEMGAMGQLKMKNFQLAFDYLINDGYLACIGFRSDGLHATLLDNVSPTILNSCKAGVPGPAFRGMSGGPVFFLTRDRDHKAVPTLVGIMNATTVYHNPDDPWSIFTPISYVIANSPSTAPDQRNRNSVNAAAAQARQIPGCGSP